MKKIISLVCSAAMILSLAACGSTQDSQKADTEPTPTAEQMVDENLITVDVTLPAEYFTDQTEEEIIQSANDDEYFSSAKVNDDGSVTYTMSKAKYKLFMKELESSMDEMFSQYPGNSDAGMECVTDVQHNKDFTEVTFTVDPELYNSYLTFTSVAIYYFCAYYQLFNGSAYDDVHVVINYVDMNTGDVLDSFDSANLGE